MAWATCLAVGVLALAAAAAGGDPGDSASGSLTRTADGKLALTVQNTGQTTTLHYLRLDLDPAFVPAGPTMSGGTCGAGSTANQFACSGFSLAPGQSLVVTFDTNPAPYPDNRGGTLHVSSGGSSDATSPVSGPPPSGGTTVECHADRFTKFLVALDKNIQPLPGIHRLDNGDYAVAEGVEVTFEVDFGLLGDCPELHARDLLPANFAAQPGKAIMVTHEGDVRQDLTTQFDQTEAGQEQASIAVPPETNAAAPEVFWKITGKFTKLTPPGKPVVNSARLDGVAGAVSEEVRIHVVTREQISHLKASATKVSGDVTEAKTGKGARASRVGSAALAGGLSAPKRVDVAVRKLGGKGCLWLRNKRASFKQTKKVGGKCTPIWLKAHGKKHWSLRFLKRLPVGRYLVQARVTDVAGVASDPRRGQVSFRVR